MRATALGLLSICLMSTAIARAEPAEQYATGVVFDDRNGNGLRDRFEPGVPDTVVSNGRDVALADRSGRYRIAVSRDTIVFVVKPSGWATPLDADGLPRFYYVHKPDGSPPGLAFPGVEPTGPLPDSIDFPLTRSREPDAFRALVFGDTQPYTLEQVEYLTHDIVDGLIGSDAAFGITLGDVVGDDLTLYPPLNGAIGRIGIPWYNVHGNHDLNFRANDDVSSDETWERVYGPGTYAFAYGPVHFLVLDDVEYLGWNEAEDRQGGYVGALSDRQLDFVRNYLSTVPPERLVVLAMHIPFDGPPGVLRGLDALFEILRDRPYTLSLAAHTHFQKHRFYGREEGFQGARPHHQLVAATTCGSWWLGALDEVGIPHTTMRGGAPNGYTIASFDGHDYTTRFYPARRPADHQMNVYAPDFVASSEAGSTEVLVNVFAGSERTKVEMRLDDGAPWTPLFHEPREDPYYTAAVERDKVRVPRPMAYLPPAIPSPHTWVATLPVNPPTGSHTLTVRATDQYGQVFEARRVIQIE